MSRITRKLKRIWERIFDKEYRENYMEEVVFSDIAAQVFSIRQHRGWTQSMLAEKIGVGQSKISAIESRNHNISLKTLLKISNALDIALDVKLVSFSDFVRAVAVPKQKKAIVSFDDDSLPEVEFAESVFSNAIDTFAVVGVNRTFSEWQQVMPLSSNRERFPLVGAQIHEFSETDTFKANVAFTSSGVIREENCNVH